MKAWYFSDASKKLRFGDGRDISLGTTHTVEGKPVLCKHGLHASVDILDALTYATGTVLWEVEVGGQVVEGNDKICGTERTYIGGGIDIESVLRAFACKAALSVSHLWDMPPVVKEYLETQNPKIRQDAYAAAAHAYAAASHAASHAAYAAAAAYAASHAAYAAAAAYAARGQKRAELSRLLTAMVREYWAKAEGRKE